MILKQLILFGLFLKEDNFVSSIMSCSYFSLLLESCFLFIIIESNSINLLLIFFYRICYLNLYLTILEFHIHFMQSIKRIEKEHKIDAP